MANDSNSIRTPLGKVRHLGSAKSGTKAVWHMRITSMALLPLSIAFVWVLLSLVGKDYATVRAAVGQPCNAIILLLFIGASIYHMKIGMQTIIEDYIHGDHSKEWALMANLFFAVAVGVACIYSVLRIGFA